MEIMLKFKYNCVNMKSYVLIFIVIFLFVNIGNTYSQNDDTNNDQEFVLFASFGIQFPEYSVLNDRLIENGYSKFGQINYSTSGGFYLCYPKSKLSILGNVSGFSQTITDQNISTSFKSTGIGVSLGYTFFSNKKLQLIPYLGTEFSWLNLNIINDVSPNSTFINYLSGTTNQYEMSATNLLANIGIVSKKSFFIDEKLFNKLVIGIRTGYSTPVLKTIWTVSETELNDGPIINTGGFYAGIIIGLEL